MLTLEEARDIATRWRPRFANPEAFITSVQRYLDRIATPARSADGLERWLREDCEQSDVVGALLAHQAPTENAPQDLPDIVDDCATCRGKRLVRRDLPVGHPEFGRLLVCPACNGRPTYRPLPPMPEPEPDRCWKCNQTRAEFAGESCTNPRWHDPNERMPAQSAVPGWKRLTP